LYVTVIVKMFDETWRRIFQRSLGGDRRVSTTRINWSGFATSR